jgi:hypothetical protein
VCACLFLLKPNNNIQQNLQIDRKGDLSDEKSTKQPIETNSSSIPKTKNA